MEIEDKSLQNDDPTKAESVDNLLNQAAQGKIKLTTAEIVGPVRLGISC